MSRDVCATIDCQALRYNLQRVRQSAANSAVLAVIKANGYGHGLVRVAKALSQADGFGVACCEEAILLREAGMLHPILLLEGIFSERELPYIIKHNFHMVVHCIEQIEWLEQQRLAKPVRVWLKLDTGMHRLGFSPESFPKIYQRLRENINVRKPIALMTHFACADNKADSATAEQIKVFNATTLQLEGIASLANSAAIIAWPESHRDWVRPGIMLYGASPFTQGTANDYQLKPVMSLTTKLITVRDIKIGESLGYGAAWTAQRNSRIGVVAIGYGDGYPRHAKTGTPVVINGRAVPLVGRVSMDMITVDLTDYPEVKAGDFVELWGKELSVDEVARCADTVSYELLCGLASRVTIAEINA